MWFWRYKGMKKEIIKKVLVAVVVLLFLSTAFVAAVPNIKITEEKNMIEKTGSGSWDESQENVTFALTLNIPYTYEDENHEESTLNHKINEEIHGCKLYEITITGEKAKYITEQIEFLDDKILTTKDSMELMSLTEQKLDLLIGAGVLPSVFSLENFSNSIAKVGEIFQKNGNFSTNWNPDFPPLPIFGRPFIGLLPGVFGFISPLGTVSPWGFTLGNLSKFPFIRPGALGLLREVELHVNESGIYVSTDSLLLEALFKNFLEDDGLLSLPYGTFWQSIWKTISDMDGSGDAHRNWTIMAGGGFYLAEILIGHSFMVGFAWSVLPNPLNLRMFLGTLYYMGSLTFPLSFTLYRTHPRPWIVTIDAGLIAHGLSCAILPVYVPDAPQTP